VDKGSIPFDKPVPYSQFLVAVFRASATNKSLPFCAFLNTTGSSFGSVKGFFQSRNGWPWRNLVSKFRTLVVGITSIDLVVPLDIFRESYLDSFLERFSPTNNVGSTQKHDPKKRNPWANLIGSKPPIKTTHHKQACFIHSQNKMAMYAASQNRKHLAKRNGVEYSGKVGKVESDNQAVRPRIVVMGCSDHIRASIRRPAEWCVENESL
jgi:hypothetical protein